MLETGRVVGTQWVRLPIRWAASKSKGSQIMGSNARIHRRNGSALYGLSIEIHTSSAAKAQQNWLLQSFQSLRTRFEGSLIGYPWKRDPQLMLRSRLHAAFIRPNDGYPPWMPTEREISASTIRVPATTTLSRAELADRVRGVIFGQALGDALGLATEFMTREEALSHYRAVVDQKGYIPFDNYLQDAHRTWWAPGDWTDDTDQMIAILDSIIKNSGNIDEVDFARRLRYWCFNGFTELGDESGAGLGVTVFSVVGDPKFLQNPHEIAEKVHRKSKGRAAANGGVMRTSVLGIPRFHDLNAVSDQTVRICKVTHADPRCVASSLAVTVAIASMLQGKCAESEAWAMGAKWGEDYLASAQNYLNPSTERNQYLKEFRDYVYNAKTLDDLQLGSGSSIGYTFKAMGAGMLLLNQSSNFLDAMTNLTMQGGDADTNAAVAGALVGCKVGFHGLPQHLVEMMPHKEWLDRKVDILLRLMDLPMAK